MKYPLTAILALALLLSACFKKDPQGEDDPIADNPPVNSKPTISGSPPTSIRIGESYSFTPSASDPDGDALTFRIANRPSWASFDTATGHLAGTPQDADVGIDADVQIAVSDGKDQAALGGFSITINQISLGSATLSWTPPTQNADGTPLTDLAGYQIYYGRSADTLDQKLTLNNPGLTLLVIENLSPAKWYFSMTSLNSRGAESERSATLSKTIT